MKHRHILIPDYENSVTRNNCGTASLCRFFFFFPLATRLSHINVSEAVQARSKFTLNSGLL